MKTFIDFLRQEGNGFRKSIMVALVAAGIINGVGVAVAVNAVGSLKPGQISMRAFLLFCACIVGYWISKQIVLDRTTVILEQIIEKVRIRILGKIRDTDLLPYESLDKGRIYATLSSDAIGISTTAGMVINASSSLIMLIFTFALVAFISKTALCITMVFVIIIVFYYLHHCKYVNEQLAQASTKENEFFDNLNGMLAGFKELKLNRDKRKDFFESEMASIIHATNEHRVLAGKAMNHTILIAHTYVFFTLAGVIFLLPLISPSETNVIPMLVPVILFASGPMADVISAIPALAKAEANINNIHRLEGMVDKSSTPETESNFVPPPSKFESLRCEQLAFQYPATGRHPFKVQPADFELKAGQIVFIVGGNGSGKSTFLKMITGLYRPNSGRILLNGEEIHEGNVTMLREMFSPIFTDFHLFKRVLGHHKLDDARIRELLDRMELSEKTSIVDGLITNTDLSTGQRKRLALVISTLDERPIHIFDEWAADQDPIFRKFFYEVLLKQMVNEGKTIIAVTHDDKYFHVADKVYAMEYGRFMDYKQNT
jgi:putative ATP-binding cassette transporter